MKTYGIGIKHAHELHYIRASDRYATRDEARAQIARLKTFEPAGAGKFARLRFMIFTEGGD
jgi:hypothetical protein